MDFNQAAHTASVWVLPVLIAVTLHEAAHGWVAWRLGDDTAKRMGRVTFNPLAHVDPFGTVILPALLLFIGAPFLFGWAKPVPVNFGRLRDPKRDMVWVALAGPGMNIALAVLAALAVHLALMLSGTAQAWVTTNLVNMLRLNVVLAVFNMLPLPPLDGGRVAVGLLPARLARPLAGLERQGFFILIALIFIVPYIGTRLGLDLNVFAWIIGAPANLLTEFIARMTGLL